MKTLTYIFRGETKETKNSQAHTALVTLLEVYFESASQLILQLYVSVILEQKETVDTSKNKE